MESCAYALVLFDFPSPVDVPWRFVGRLISSSVVLTSIGNARGAYLWDILPAVALAIAAWAQLSSAASAVAWPLHLGQFFRGVASGYVALDIIGVVVENSTLGQDARTDLAASRDLLSCCAGLYVLEWLVVEVSLGPCGPSIDMIRGGVLDLLHAGGCGHLLLKRQKLLDSVLLRKSIAPRDAASLAAETSCL